MDCKTTAERLPWYLNGTLEADEHRQIGDHLSSCDACHGELRETLFAGEVFAQHLASDVLVDIAFGRPLQGIDQTLVEHHLEHCEECAQELGMVHECRRLAAEDSDSEQPAKVLTFEPRRPSIRSVQRWGTLAACLTALVSTGGWLKTWQDSRWSEQTLMATLDSQRERIAELEAPRLNVWIEDVRATDANQRGIDRPQVERFEVPAEAPEILLLLHLPDVPHYPSYEVEMVDAAGEHQWTRSGLELQSDGVFTLGLRQESLPTADFELHIFGNDSSNRKILGRFSISIQSQ